MAEEKEMLNHLELIKARILEGFRLKDDLLWIISELEKRLIKEKSNESSI